MKKKIENRKEKKENTPPPCWTSDDGSPFLPISLSHPRGEVEKEKKKGQGLLQTLRLTPKNMCTRD
jgi:hypothetical protein